MDARTERVAKAIVDHAARRYDRLQIETIARRGLGVFLVERVFAL